MQVGERPVKLVRPAMLAPGGEFYTIGITSSPSTQQQSEVNVMAKGNNAQGKDRKKAKAAPKKPKAESKKAAPPKKS